MKNQSSDFNVRFRNGGRTMSNVKDRKLFWSLLLWNMLPALYLLIRMKIVAVSNTSINILGQLEWFDLIDEVLVTALTVPLFKILPRGKKHNCTYNQFQYLYRLCCDCSCLY